MRSASVGDETLGVAVAVGVLGCSAGRLVIGHGGGAAARGRHHSQRTAIPAAPLPRAGLSTARQPEAH